MLAAERLIDPLVGNNYAEELLLAAEKIAVMTMLCGFFSILSQGETRIKKINKIVIKITDLLFAP